MSKKSSVVIISRHDAMNSGRIEKHWDSTAVSDLACDHDHGMAFSCTLQFSTIFDLFCS